MHGGTPGTPLRSTAVKANEQLSEFHVHVPCRHIRRTSTKDKAFNKLGKKKAEVDE